LAPPNYFFSIWPPQSLKAGSAPANIYNQLRNIVLVMGKK
jgi:hypothetical protein